MQLSPLNPSEPIRPRPSASLLRQSVERLIEDGVEILGQRKLGPVSLGVRKLTSFEEVSNRLGREVLQLILPGMVAVPLKGAEELQAALVLKAGQPAETLQKPDLARDLQQLADQGWRYYNAQGEIGLYGAYSFVGQQPVEAGCGEVKVKLSYVEACQQMAKFYAGDSLAAKLEQEGYQFYRQQALHPGQAGAELAQVRFPRP